MKAGRNYLSLLFLTLALIIGAFGCNGSTGPQGVPGTNGTNGTNATVPGVVGEGAIIVAGVQAGDPQESIYVRKVGHGPQTIVLVPGNNTSGAIFQGILDVFRADMALNDAYTVYTFDYRGSGYSSYNKKITGLKDFAADFEKVMNTITGFPTSGVTLVGYSMGFGVGLEMLIANPARYANVVSLTGIGTRGVRVSFNAATAGTDSTGKAWANGDWVEITNDSAGMSATALQQASWQGDNRTFSTIQSTWNFVVFEDILKYDITKYGLPTAVTDPTFTTTLEYTNALLDGLTIQYMPESLYYAHKFNVSTFDVVAPAKNSDGVTVTIPGDKRLGTILTGKKAMLVKAHTDFANWRGDQVIYDNYTATTKYDLKQAGATVDAVIINPNQGYDHGFPVAHPLQVVRLIDTFIKGTLSATTASTALSGTTLTLYPNSETIWETSVFTGF